MGDPAVLKLLGANLARARGDRSQSEIAAKSRIDISTISDLENGRRNPSVTTLARIAAAVGVNIEDLFRSVPTAKNGAPPATDAAEKRFSALERRLDALERRRRK
jgi:transcriptional regulator with XRE-family HTH domain